MQKHPTGLVSGGFSLWHVWNGSAKHDSATFPHPPHLNPQHQLRSKHHAKELLEDVNIQCNSIAKPYMTTSAVFNPLAKTRYKCLNYSYYVTICISTIILLVYEVAKQHWTSTASQPFIVKCLRPVTTDDNQPCTYVLINCAALSPFHFILRLASFSPADRQFSHQLSRWDQVLVQTTWHRVQHWLWGSRGLWCLGVWFASGFEAEHLCKKRIQKFHQRQ